MIPDMKQLRHRSWGPITQKHGVNFFEKQIGLPLIK